VRNKEETTDVLNRGEIRTRLNGMEVRKRAVRLLGQEGLCA
jgi:hypothetical protein